MLKVHTLVLGPLQTNCYIIHDESSKNCCVIDPGYTPEIILDTLEQLELTPEAILLTHGHFDHVGGVKDLVAETGCKVYLCPEELVMPSMLTAGKLYYTDPYGEGDTLQLAGLTVGVLHTPGHTPGCVCLAVEDTLFSGDTLFAGSCGRIDLPGGSRSAMLKSLSRLASLETNYWVRPGHGESTTLAEEKRYNPYMK